VRLLLRRSSALLAILAIWGGNPAVCAGWLPTPEARMACCAEEHGCPMHDSESRGSGTLTQAQADSCCASSERDTSRESIPTFVAMMSAPVQGAAILLAASIPTVVLRERWRIIAPVPTAPTPKHVLLSVFLV
jgi:hypothetical protein